MWLSRAKHATNIGRRTLATLLLRHGGDRAHFDKVVLPTTPGSRIRGGAVSPRITRGHFNAMQQSWTWDERAVWQFGPSIHQAYVNTLPLYRVHAAGSHAGSPAAACRKVIPSKRLVTLVVLGRWHRPHALFRPLFAYKGVLAAGSCW